MPKKFVVNDDAVLNDRGFRVLTSGIRLGQFQKNPIGYFMHARPDRWNLNENTILPPCVWSDPEVVGSQLLSEPTFDENDEFAVKLQNKVEGGFIRMASIGFIPITTSSDPRYLLPGQTYETVVECELVEISIVDRGSNPNAIALYKRNENGELVQLKADEETNVIPLISKEKETEQIQETQKMDKIAILVGLTAGATEDQICAAVTKLIGEKQELTTKVETVQLASITSAVDQAIADKRITADKKEHFIGLGKAAGIESLTSTLELMKPSGKPTDIIDSVTGGKSEGTVTLASLIGKGMDEVKKFKAENPAEYAKLYKEHYGREFVPES